MPANASRKVRYCGTIRELIRYKLLECRYEKGSGFSREELLPVGMYCSMRFDAVPHALMGMIAFGKRIDSKLGYHILVLSGLLHKH